MTAKHGSLLLKSLIAIYGVIYFAGFLLPIFTESRESLSSEMSTSEYYTIPIACILFLVGAIYVWFNEKIGGIILLIWHFVVWFLSMFIWREAGMVLILIFPMLIPPVFLIRNWYKQHYPKYLQSIHQWKLILRILLINYAAIYLIIISAEIVQRLFNVPLRGDLNNSTTWDYSMIETVILFFELGLFAFACIASFWSRKLTGFLLIIWYIIIAIASQQNFEIGNSGPWIIFSIPLAVQGLLYFVVHVKESD